MVNKCSSKQVSPWTYLLSLIEYIFLPNITTFREFWPSSPLLFVLDDRALYFAVYNFSRSCFTPFNHRLLERLFCFFPIMFPILLLLLCFLSLISSSKTIGLSVFLQTILFSAILSSIGPHYYTFFASFLVHCHTMTYILDILISNDIISFSICLIKSYISHTYVNTGLIMVV